MQLKLRSLSSHKGHVKVDPVINNTAKGQGKWFHQKEGQQSSVEEMTILKKQRELKRKRKIRGFPPEWMISGKYFQDLGP